MSLEKMKLEVELMRVKASKAEMELKIAERMEEINRVKEHIKVQEDKIQDLELKIKNI